MNNHKFSTEIKVLIGIIGVLALALLWIQCMNNQTLRIIYWIGVIILLFFLGVKYGPSLSHAINSYIAKTAANTKTEINIPEKEAISGSFVCPSCGATTEIVSEVYPKTTCKFCGAALSDLQSVLQMRDNHYQDLCKQEIEHKIRMREEQEHNNYRLRELESQKEIEEAKQRHAESLERINAEQVRQEQKTKIEIAAFLIIGAIVVIYILTR